MNQLRAIPQEWVKEYVDKLIAIAKSLDNGSAMQSACLLRAEFVMDMVKAFRESQSNDTSAN